MSANQEKWLSMPEEIYSKGRLELIDEMVAPDFVDHGSLPPGSPQGREGFKEFVQVLRQAFPNVRYEVDRASSVDGGDLQAVNVTAHGTQTGEFMGLPPTGKQVTWQETHIGRFEDGWVKDHWGVVDMLAIFQQLGLVPMPGEQGQRPSA